MVIAEECGLSVQPLLDHLQEFEALAKEAKKKNQSKSQLLKLNVFCFSL